MNIRNYFKYVLIIIIIVLSFISYNQYKDKVIYQEYISNKLNEDIHTLISSIDENKRVYKDIISTSEVTKDQSKTLMTNNENIRNIITDYRKLAIELKKQKEGYQYDKTSFNADRLAHLYYDWHEETYDNQYNEKLDLDEQQQIKFSNQLNSSWIDVTNKFTSVHFELDHKDWSNLLDGLETNTLSFLRKNKVESIEEFWNKRPDNK